MPVKFINCGRVKYSIALIDMKVAAEAVRDGQDECVFLTEHENLYSVGKSSTPGDFLKSSPDLQIYYSDRGGMVTVHSPGQIVVYPIVNLAGRDMGVGQYVSILEEWMIRVLRICGIMSFTSDRGRGVWTDSGKIGFVGIRVERGVSHHGLCMNVSNDLTLFEGIVPCGMKGLSVTSIERILRRTPPPISEMSQVFVSTSPF
jgi:lipoate-protein ligase B